jgi:hypothetical protein
VANPDDEPDDEPRPRPRRKRPDEEDIQEQPPARPRRREEPPPSRKRRPRDEEDDDYDYEGEPPLRRRRPRMSRAELRAVAWYQKAIILCIVAVLGTIPVRIALSTLPVELARFGWMGVVVYGIAAEVTGAVFVFMLAMKIYSRSTGILLGILTLIPCVGLITLLVINSTATAILRMNGIRVGLLGARASDIP